MVLFSKRNKNCYVNVEWLASLGASHMSRLGRAAGTGPDGSSRRRSRIGC